MKNIYNIMSAVSFAGVLFIFGMLVFVNVTREGREAKNELHIQNVVDDAVYKAIRSSMPDSTGKVAR
tara:strand:+ start:303 stop:503 length:201 start_codon:yes stop_codon:yes gene_type:complete